MNKMLKDAAILFVITLIVGAVLGYVYELTKGPIAEQEKKAKEAAWQEVFVDAASFETMETSEEEMTAKISAEYPDASINEVVKALDGSGELIGYVVTVTSHAGYGGNIQYSMGIKNDGTVNGISILSISETPGLGMRAEEVLKPQFAGKQVDHFSVSKTGATSDEEIDAISGATITSNAVVGAANAGLYYFQTELGGGTND